MWAVFFLIKDVVAHTLRCETISSCKAAGSRKRPEVKFPF